MKAGNNKLKPFSLFLLSAGSGIAMFVSSWNSFLQGKEKIYLALAFLILFLVILIVIYFHFSRLYSLNVVNKSSGKNLPADDKTSEKNSALHEINNSRESSSGILKGVFSKPVLKSIGDKLLKNLAQEFEIVQGVFYVLNPASLKFSMIASFALAGESLPTDFEPGEGITGQAVADGKIMIIPNLPESFSPVISGLGIAKARYLYVVPLLYEKKSIAAVEFSCFKEIDDSRLPMLSQLMQEGGINLSPVLSPETK